MYIQHLYGWEKADSSQARCRKPRVGPKSNHGRPCLASGSLAQLGPVRQVLVAPERLVHTEPGGMRVPQAIYPSGTSRRAALLSPGTTGPVGG